MKDKNKGNENKIILRKFSSTMNKMNGDDGNITQRIYRCQLRPVKIHRG